MGKGRSILPLAAAALVTCTVARGGDEGKLTARQWFNTDRTNKPADRASCPMVVLFFQPEGRENARWAREVNRIARRPDLRVVGISPAGPEAVERFIRRHRLRFRIGAGSECAAAFGVHSFPALRRIEPQRPDEHTEFDLTEVRRLGPDRSAFSNKKLTKLDLKRMEEWELMALIESGVEGEIREVAIRQLYQVADPNTFIRFAEERLPVEPDPWARGELEYLADLRRGVARDDDVQPPSVAAFHAFRAEPDAPVFARAREFEKAAPSLSAAELGERYARESVEDPAGAMIKRFAIYALHKAEDRKEARAVLMRILSCGERDRSLRLNAVMVLSDVCGVGDHEAADLLDRLAAVETNALHVRPMMEYISRYLRTGKEDRNYDEYDEAELLEETAPLGESTEG